MIILLVDMVVVFGLMLLAAAMLGSTFGDAPFVPTGRSSMRRIMRVAAIAPGEVFFDLGAGDGRFVRAAANAGATAYGFERVRILVLWSRFMIWLQRLSGKAFMRRQNIFDADLRAADVVYTYLFPNAMAKLEDKALRELKPGARIVSRAFRFPNWKPEAVHQLGKYSPPVYVYRKAVEVAQEAFLA